MEILWPRQEVLSGEGLLRTLEGGGVTSGTEGSSSRISSRVSSGRASASEEESTDGELVAMALRLEEAKREDAFAVDGTEAEGFLAGS